MKFRSWYLVLIGMVIQAIFGLVLLFSADDAEDWGGLFFIIGGIVVFSFVSLGIIPLILLLFHNTRKVGAAISIVFGIFGLIFKFGFIIGVFLIIAGILALRRKA